MAELVPVATVTDAGLVTPVANGLANIYVISGGQQGTSTDFLIAPEKQAAVVVLTNMEDISPNELSMNILRILLGLPEKKEDKK